MNDTIVIDIETSNFFTDPEVGRDNFSALKISAIGIYSYNLDEYFCFDEYQIKEALEFFKNAKLIVGFSMNRYDIPVLNNYFLRIDSSFNLWHRARYDILDEIEKEANRRVGLGLLAYANLGIGKSGDGAKAIELYKEGRISELKEYCLQDVRITKDLYDLIKKDGYLLMPQKDKSGTPLRVEFTSRS